MIKIELLNTIHLDGISYKIKNIDQFLNIYMVINEHSVVAITENGEMFVDELQLSSEQ